VPECALGIHHGIHGDPLDACTGIGIGRPSRLAFALCQQAGGDDQRTARHHGRCRDNVAHGEQFFLARLAPGSQVVNRAADVFKRQANVLAGSDVVLSLM
jgi:hypothetical protein